MNQIKKLFFWKKNNRVLTPLTDQSPLKVIEVEPDAPEMDAALGITDERKKELAELVITSYGTSKNLIEAMSKISVGCKHANELFLTSWLLSEVHRKNNMISSMLGMLGGK